MPQKPSSLTENFDETSLLRQKAQKKVMDLLAVRIHTELELRQKLATFLGESEFSEELVNEALEYAKSKNWIEEASVQAERIAESLHQKKKGIHFINNYLQEKGLPTVPEDNDLELEKALELVKSKIKEEHRSSSKEQAKAARFLASRGFDSEIVRKVLYEKF